ncbi:YSIRK-type signal peptide-containing protein [Staphylococcus sp. GDY8P131P]|uniref:GA-like domain-containing protein n=1 Tax=Staphylococcus sp. GDY8P131P TaxID=2804159 RepID=UPI001AEBF74D|nr:YSIRK-type signal peptide-containing protein [Staphylococcus sp. GDY8P131P]
MRIFKEYIARRNNRYSIRKFNIGTASILLGSILIFSQSGEAQADMLESEDKSALNDIDNIDKQVNPDKNEEKNTLINSQTHNESESASISQESNNNLSKNVPHNIPNKEDAEDQKVNIEDPNIVHNKPQIEQNQHQNDIKPQENKTGDDVQTEKQIKSSSESNFKQTNKLLNDKENNILSNDNEIEKTSAVKPNVSIKSDIETNDRNNTGENTSKQNVNFTNSSAKVMSFKNAEETTINKNIKTNKENIKQQYPNKPKSRVARSLDRLLYFNNIRKIGYNPKLNYTSVQAGDFITTAIREVEKNRNELTEEERKLFLRNIIRQTVLKNNKFSYDAIFNGNYGIATNKKLNAYQANNINQLLYKMKDLTLNRNNDDYRAVYTFTNQSDVTKNHFGIVQDDIFYDDGDVLIATMVLSKEKGRGTYRFENYAIRPNESLNKKIKKVFAEYEGRQRVMLEQDHLGYYSYTRPHSGSNGNPNTGGGSGGTVKFYISFDANHYIDVKKDKLFGYILSDTIDPHVLRGVNITNQSVDIDDVATRINKALTKSKKKKAEEAIQTAEQAKQYAEQQLSKVLADGAVSPAEKRKVDEANHALEEAKQIAITKLNGVLSGTAGKNQLQGRLDQIGTVNSPKVNDLDSNGVADDIQLSEAAQAVQKAEQAKQTVDQKLVEVTRDGLINPNEKNEIDRLNKALKVAKTTASEKVNNLPEGIKDKIKLQKKLEKIDTVTLPEVNDVDSNGVLDTEQLSQASQAVQAAEQAKRDVNQKLEEVTKDRLITPSEKALVDKLNNDLQIVKSTAAEKINNVPNNMTGKGELQTRLGRIDTVTSPEVNDRDSNGVLDTEQLSEAAQAIEAAEQARQAADNKLTEITADGLINPDEKAELDGLIEALETAKTNALEKLNNVPDGTTGKDALQTRLDQIGTVTAPEVNDQDGNGVKDTEQLSEAEQSIVAVEQAKQAAANKLIEVTSDGLVNPNEKAELEELIEALETAKAEASAKLNSVPDGTTGKDELQTRINQVGSVTAPEVNDQDANGVLDTEQLSKAEEAITAVEEAKKAAANKLSEITSDNLVNPSEKAELDQLIEVLETAKADALTKLNNVPNGTTGKAELQKRLDQIGTVTAPEVNDQDGNGVLDTEQLSEAEQTIAAVEQAKKAVDNKLAEITSDNLVNPSEKAELDQLIEALETAKAEAAAKLNSVPDGTTGKDGLQTRLDQIGPVTLPEVNDQDSNGVLDTEQLSKAEEAITAVERAKKAVDNKLSEITEDGLVNPSEKAELEKLIETLEIAKINASEKLNNVPDGTTGKDGLQTRLDQIDSVTLPEVNDQDANGVLDTEQLSKAEEVITAAERAKKAVDNKLSEITADGLVNSNEKAELDKLIELLESAKIDASVKLNSVPNGTTGKADLQTRLDQIGTVTLPKVNDQDGNGVLDTDQLSEAEQAIEAMEKAKKAVDNKLSEITADNLINLSEKAELDQLVEALEIAKAEASAKLNSVPDGTTGKDELQTRLDQIGTVTSPEVNDQDSNGVLDTEQLSEAEQAIEAVEEAKKAVDNKLTEITSDGLVNPSEKAELEELIEALETAKAEASAKLNSVPDGTTGKDELQTRIKQVGSVTAPEVNDQDANGVLDTEQLSKAEEAITAVEEAKKAAANKLSEITSDNLVNPSEKAELDQLIEVLETAKADALTKLNNVPNGTTGKDGLQTRLDQIGTVTSPEVNDQDSNGVLDTEQLSEAEAAITTVEQAKNAVDNKLSEITSDGLINPSEKAELDQLIETLETAKAEASTKLNNVPTGTTGKAELQTRLDQIDSVTAPEINDQDSNGVLDTEQLSEAERAIEAVEEAKKAADNKLSEITSDNLVNPSEKTELDKLIEALETAKAEASTKLNNVPDGTTGKDGLQTRLDQIDTVTLPKVNDQDSNGVLDTEQLSEAEQAIARVEEAKKAVNNKLAEITSDNLVNPSEKVELEQLIEALKTAKADASTKLSSVPNGTTGKDTLQTRFDQIGSVTLPEVNDQDGNGVLDTEQLSETEQAIVGVEQAKQAVDNKLAEITSDGLVNPNEKAELEKLIKTLETAKVDASAKLNSVPNGTTGKDGLQTRLDQIGTVTLPKVNDQDSNGVLDTEQLSEAEEAIEAVEEAKKVVDNKLTEITSDGLINPEEKAELEKLIEVLETAKAEASAKLNSVPNGTTGKDELQTRLKQIDSVTAPEVNDRDSNGVLDTEQLLGAEQAIQAAEEAKKIAANKLTEIMSDDLVNSGEKLELDQLVEALETAKTNASEKLNNVPDSTTGKDELQSRLDQIGSVTIPEVNDQDGNGVLDTEQLSEAEQAIAAVEQAKKAVDNKLSEVKSDGLVNPSEKAELDQLIGALETAKAEASTKLNNVPDGTTGKDALQTRLDQIGTVTLPKVNDQDGNGVLDTDQLSEAEEAIEAMEQAKNAVDNKLSEITSDGLINPSEKDELDQLIETLETAKAEASAKLNSVPDGTTGKDGLQTRLDQIGTVTSPEVNDRDSNGVLDTEQLSEAAQAIEAAEQAKQDADNKLSEITADNLINPSEKAGLDKLIEALERAKAEASTKLNSVPDDTTGKDGLQTRLGQIVSVTAPEINDQDSNGVLDTEQLSEAEQAIAAVEQAKQDVNNKLSEITADNLINPTEKGELEKLIETLETAKRDASTKLNNVPNGTTGKADLQTRLDQIVSVTAPEVNDQDANGVLDTEQLSKAEQAIEAVEQAKSAVDNKLTEITSDRLVNPSEKAELDQLIEALETAKADALTKLNNVPNGTTGKDGLQTRLDQIDSVTAPEVNDTDSNGVLDTEQLFEAEQAIAAVEQAKQDVNNKLSEVTFDGLVNPSEKAELNQLIEALETAKADALTKLNNVPNGTTGKAELQTRLDQIGTVTILEVNDQDSNGVLDTEQLSEAEQAIEAAEQAKQEADNKLSEITSDNLVNPNEKAELDQLIEALESAKADASAKLNIVPNGTTGKADLQIRLDQIVSVTVPEVNDQDGNGVLDTEQLSEAEQAIEAAKKAVDNKLSEVTLDGLVNPSEKAELNQLIEALETAKVEASTKLNNVPDGITDKDALQTRLDQIGSVSLPEVNDQDANGVLDTEQLSKAEQAIEAVEQAKSAVDNKLTEITSDRLVNPSEKAELDQLIEALETAKADALTKLNNVPNGTTGKDVLQTRLDQIGTVTAPEVNDRDSNGVLDTEQLSEAEQAIEAVEEAKKVVDNKLVEITADGLVNPNEKAELDKLIKALETAKAEASTKLNSVPNGTAGKVALQTRLNQIDSVAAPEINDRDSNGVLDTEQLSEAEQAIVVVEESKKAADNKLAEITSDNLVNPSEKAELDQLIEALETAKAEASTKLNNVPTGTTGKDGLQTRLDQIGTVTSPEINDQDGNGVLDTEQLSEAEQAIEAVEEAKKAVDNKLTEITSDGLVNLDEKAELDQLIEALKTAKANASEKLNNVPDGTAGKGDLQKRLDQINLVTSSSINDKDGNGILDIQSSNIKGQNHAKVNKHLDNTIKNSNSHNLINKNVKVQNLNDKDNTLLNERLHTGLQQLNIVTDHLQIMKNETNESSEHSMNSLTHLPNTGGKNKDSWIFGTLLGAIGSMMILRKRQAKKKDTEKNS